MASCGVHLAGCDAAPTPGSTDDDGIDLTGSVLTLDLALVSSLAAEGDSLWVSDADVIVVHAPGEDYRAFRSVCAHEGNPVRLFEPTDSGYQLRCSSHDWTYDLEGEPTGIAERSVPRLTLTREGNLLRIDLPEA